MKAVLYTQLQYEDSMVVAQKWKCRPMEQDRKPRNKLMHPQQPSF